MAGRSVICSLFIKRQTTYRKGKFFSFLGRLEREKGIVDLCEAFLQALDSHPSYSLILPVGDL